MDNLLKKIKEQIRDSQIDKITKNEIEYLEDYIQENFDENITKTLLDYYTGINNLDKVVFYCDIFMEKSLFAQVAFF